MGEDDVGFRAVFGAAGVSGCVLPPFGSALALRDDVPVGPRVLVGAALDGPPTERALGAGPAAVRTTEEHTVQLETASRAAKV